MADRKQLRGETWASSESLAALGGGARIGLFAAAVSEALDSLMQGILLVDRTGVVLFANRAARAALAAADCLTVDRQNRLSSRTNAQCGRLRALVAQTCQAGAGRTAWSLPGESGRHSLFLWMLPLASADGRGDMALLLLADAERAQSQPETLRTIFGLTPRQADLASCLAAGHGLREIARRLSIDYETVRSHVREVRERTGTHRQADLVRVLLMATLAASPGRVQPAG